MTATAPSHAKAIAMARPMPWPEPVTMATLPLRRVPMGMSSVVRRRRR